MRTLTLARSQVNRIGNVVQGRHERDDRAEHVFVGNGRERRSPSRRAPATRRRSGPAPRRGGAPRLLHARRHGRAPRPRRAILRHFAGLDAVGDGPSSRRRTCSRAPVVAAMVFAVTRPAPVALVEALQP